VIGLLDKLTKTRFDNN